MIEARMVVTQCGSGRESEARRAMRTAPGVPIRAATAIRTRNQRSRRLTRRRRRSDSVGTASASAELVDLLSKPDDQLGVDREQLVQQFDVVGNAQVLFA